MNENISSSSEESAPPNADLCRTQACGTSPADGHSQHNSGLFQFGGELALRQAQGERKCLSVRPELVEGQLSPNLKYARTIRADLRSFVVKKAIGGLTHPRRAVR
jgi:hypothetical protein